MITLKDRQQNSWKIRLISYGCFHGKFLRECDLKGKEFCHVYFIINVSYIICIYNISRWFLDVMGYPRKSRLFMLNAITMTTTFFLARIATIPPYWLKIYSIYGSPDCDRLGNLWYVLISTCLILDSINIVWFVKLFQGLRRFLKSNSDSRARNWNWLRLLPIFVFVKMFQVKCSAKM